MDISKLMREKDDLLAERQELLSKATQENRGLTQQEVVRDKSLQNSIDRYSDQIRKAQDIQNQRMGSTPAQIEAATKDQGDIKSGTYRAEGSAQQQVKGFQPTGYTTEHKSMADFIRDVRFPTERRVMSMGVGETGGFMIPDQLIRDVLTIDPEEFIISYRATEIPPFVGAPDAATTIPALDVSGDNGTFGGVEMKWLAEGGTKHETEPELLEVKLEPQEIAGHVVITDKLIRNGGSEFNIFLNRVLGNALNAAIERSFLTGTGVGMPTGITQAPCRIDVARAGGGAIAYQDLVDMISVFGPGTWARGLWIVSQSALASLLVMPDPGAGGTLILKPSDLRLGQPANMMGLPVMVSSRVPALGSTGDLMLIEPSYYLKKMGSGPFIDMSDGYYFTSNKSIIKIFSNIDGQPWLTQSILAEDGTTRLSPFVLLEA